MSSTTAHIPSMNVTLCSAHVVDDAARTWGGITPGYTVKASRATPSPMGCEACGATRTLSVVRLVWSA